MNTASFGTIGQQGYVVQHLDQAIKTWATSLAIGPWLVIRNVEFNGHFRGERTSVLLNIALAYNGDQQIELIEQINKAPSPYQQHGPGFCGPHHIGYFFEDNFNEAVGRAKTQGLVLEYDVVTASGGHYKYYTLPEQPHSYVEFIELDEMTCALFEQLKQAPFDSHTTIFQEFSF